MTTATKQKSGIKIMVKDVTRFSDKISRVADACSNSSSIPILTCMKIEVKAGSVVFTGGDGIRTICIGEKDIVEADEDTAIAVPASLFSQIINKLPSGAVEMTLREKTLLIKAGTAKFELQVLDVEEYPAITFGGSAVTNFTIPASQLTAAFRNTMYACSTNQTYRSCKGFASNRM